MDHDKATELFSSYIDGDLAPTMRAELEQHLSVCIQCRTDLAALRKTVGGLSSLRRPVPPSFLPQIQQQIFVRSRGRFFGKRWKLFGRVPFEWVSLVTIIAMLVYYIIHLHGSPTGVRPAP